MGAGLRQFAGAGASGDAADEQFGRRQAGLNQRHRGEQRGGGEAARVAYVRFLDGRGMFRHCAGELAQQLRRAMLGAVYVFVSGCARIAKIRRRIHDVHVDVFLRRSLQRLGNRGCRRPVRSRRKQREFAAGIQRLQPCVVRDEFLLPADHRQVAKTVADACAGAAVGNGGGQFEIRVPGNQAQQFAANVTACSQYHGRDHLAHAASFRNSCAILSPSATPWDSALMAGSDSRSSIC